MAYELHNFKSKDKLYASQLNEMDAQIGIVSSDVDDAFAVLGGRERLEFDIVPNKYLNASTGNEGNMSGDCYTIIKVETGHEYYITTNLSTSPRGIVFYNDTTYISGLTASDIGSTRLVDYSLTIPSGCNHLGITCSKYETNDFFIDKKVEKRIVNVVEVDKRLSDVESKLTNDVEKELSVNIVKDKFINLPSGSIGGISDSAYCELEVLPNEVYLVSGYFLTNIGVAFYRNNGSIISYITSVNVIRAVDYRVVVPEDCSKMSVSTRYTSEIPVRVKKVDRETVNVVSISNAINRTEKRTNDVLENVEQIPDRIFALESRMGFKFNGMDNGQIIFMFDDASNNMGDYLTIFQQHNMPFSMAVPTNRLGKTLTNGMTVNQALDAMVALGGEVLSHSTDGYFCNVETKGSIEAVENVLKTSKQELVNAGYDIDGWVSPSGIYEPLALKLYPKYYRYGYQAGERMPFNMNRPYLRDLKLAGAKAKVDEVATNKTVQILFAHFNAEELAQFTLSDLDELLTYIASKNVEVTTFRHCFYAYGSHD